jgi:hypothetical protein
METLSGAGAVVRKTFHLPAPLVCQLERLAALEHRSVTGQVTRLLEQALASQPLAAPASVVITQEGVAA